MSRFVSFIDILGFKELVAKNSHAEVLDKLTMLSSGIEHIKETMKKEEVKLGFGDVQLIPYLFSDSVVIFTKDDSIGSCKLLLFACQYLFYNCLKIQLPIKGALAHGEITIDTDKSIFFGQPIIDSFLLQEELKYYGLILHHSVEKHLKNIDDENYNVKNILFNGKTPTKSGSITYSNLKYWLPDKEILKLDQILDKLYESVSGGARIYVDNTIDMSIKMNN